MTPHAAALHDKTVLVFFAGFVIVSFVITIWTARRLRSTKDFYAAGAKISAWQNALALSGEFLSAAALLGSAGYVSMNGADGIAFTTYATVGFAMLLFMVAEPLRNLGKYTFSDVLAYRVKSLNVRVISAINGIVVVILYMILQLVAGGNLFKLLFNLSYHTSVILIGTLLLVYTLIGGMIAATWLQIVKAVLMLLVGAIMLLLVLLHFGGNPLSVLRAAAALKGPGILGPAKMMGSPAQAISLAFGMFGVISLPQVLMRFYTVPDVRVARRSVFYAIIIIGLFTATSFFLGFAAMVLVGSDVIQGADKGGNLAIPLLAEYLGGNLFLSYVTAVAFATILAVVSGLIVTGSTALSYDIWMQAIRKKASQREQLIVARLATVALCAVGVALSLFFQGQNIGWLVSLGSGLSASTIFPTLILAIYWPKLTAIGAGAGLITGLLSNLVIIYLSPFVQVDILHHAHPVIGLRNPAIIGVPAAFFVTWIVSMATWQQEGLDHYKDVEHKMVVGSLSP